MAAAKKMYGVRLLPALMVLSLLCVAVAIALLLLGQRGAGAQVRASEQQANELVMLSQRLPVQANAALGGADDAFDVLARTRTRFDALAATLGAQMQRLPAATEVLRHSDAILAARPAIQEVHRSASELRTLMPQLMQGLGNLASTLDDQSMDELARRLERFELTGMRLQQDVQALAGGTGDVSVIARRLADGNDYLGQVLSSVAAGSARAGASSEARYRNVEAAYRQLGERVRAAIGAVDQVRVAREANAALALSADAIYSSFAGRDDGPKTPLQRLLADATLPIALLAAGLLTSLLATIGYIGSGNIRKSLEQQAAKNERNQEAILRLLDELSSLADGDLTVQATVSEDITGAIADSINYAIEALRELVATINQSALSLDSSAREAQGSADELARASVTQSRQVALASEAVAAMATSTEEISGNAERSADVARHSVEIAHKGGVAVRRTIDGMNAIRETIQETSKRIKRLGESSQEIGNIVELINDIAEQTNILALNASIQASMAGEAGRGFAVVADEVQRLAERAANATKQIEVLVRTIQADTNEAVVSMERSTTDVVGGALLAENAGGSLEEIEQVSNQIANLVQNISASSRQQAAAAQNMARNMDTLREISAQTADNSATTSNSVTTLAQLSAQLRESVSGFRLPQSVQVQAAPQTLPPPAAPPAAMKVAAEVAAIAGPALMPAKKVSGLGA